MYIYSGYIGALKLYNLIHIIRGICLAYEEETSVDVSRVYFYNQRIIDLNLFTLIISLCRLLELISADSKSLTMRGAFEIEVLYLLIHSYC